MFVRIKRNKLSTHIHNTTWWRKTFFFYLESLLIGKFVSKKFFSIIIIWAIRHTFFFSLSLDVWIFFSWKWRKESWSIPLLLPRLFSIFFCLFKMAIYIHISHLELKTRLKILWWWWWWKLSNSNLDSEQSSKENEGSEKFE